MDEKHAEDLVKALDLPAEAGVLVDDPKYWHGAVCRAVFRASDRIGFENPQAGLEIARHACQLVDRVPGRYEPGTEKTRLKGRAFVILGSRLRSLARLREANRAYRVAAVLCHGEAPLDRADRLRRYVYLRIDQRVLGDAMVRANQMVELYLEHGDDHLVGSGLLCRGEVHYFAKRYQLAKRDYGEAAKLIDPKRSRRRYYSAVHNLGAALVKSAAGPLEIDEAVDQIERAQAIGYDPESLPGLNLVWLQGQLLVKGAREREGESAYRRALPGLMKLEAWYEVALLVLDLSEVLCKGHRVGELVEIAAALFPLFGSFKANEDVIGALRLFYHAAVEQRVTVELIERVRTTIRRASRRSD